MTLRKIAGLGALLSLVMPGLALAEEAAPALNSGDTAWMLTATALVLFMTIPGLALFYGGMVRSKNVLSVMMQCFAITGLMSILWVVYGYSMAFDTTGMEKGVLNFNSFVGGFSKAFLSGVTPNSLTSATALFPEAVFITFQMTFAIITPALIVGAFAERMKFAAVLAFAVLWFTFSYIPVAHMVWYWDGPDAIKDDATLKAVGEAAGWLWAKGALDFAGGTVVHINAGIAGLIGCLIIGPRIGYKKEPMPPHSLVMTMIGASLLWIGWFGFNAGSALESNAVAALAFVNTFVATAAAGAAWAIIEQITHKKPSLLGAVSGVVAGLVAITPAAGFAHPGTAIILGAVASVICYFFVTTVKNKLGYDDSLDVFGIHAVGGIVGAIGTGIVADPALGGQGWIDYTAPVAKAGEFDMVGQVITQCWAVGTTIVWTGVVSAALFLILKYTLGLRPDAEAETNGLDISEHGERAYN